MHTRISPASFLLAFCLCLTNQPAFAKKMYRWVNEQGETVFSDQVPPEQSQVRREALNEKGRVIEVTEQAKTKEQQAMDERLQALKKAQEKVIAQQQANDKVLLSTFRSIDDMQASLYATMQSMDAQRNAAQSALKRLEDQLAAQQKQAAEVERDGKKVPANLLNDIKQTQAQIQAAHAEVDKQIDKKNRAKAEFEANIQRYKFLTQGNADTAKASDQATQAKVAAEIGLYACETDALCAKAWAAAHDFVKARSTTPIDTDTDKLIMGRAPAKDSDLSLSVSRIEDEHKKPQLFLDIRCRESSLGTELCASQKVRDIRLAFRPFIEAAIAK